jgi:hypothetical protein
MELRSTVDALAIQAGLDPPLWAEHLRDVEDELRHELSKHPDTRSAAIDYYGLHAVEAAMLRNALIGEPNGRPLVDAPAFFTAQELFACSPPTECWGRVLEASTMRDVMPLWGDMQKAFGPGDAPLAERFAQPANAVGLYEAVRTRYLATPTFGRYRRMAIDPALIVRAGLWMLKAATLLAAETRASGLTAGDGELMVAEYLSLVRQRVGQN